MREQYMRCGEGFIICYSITDRFYPLAIVRIRTIILSARGNDYSYSFYRHSFNEAVEYRNLIAKVRASEEVPVILVANKVGRRRKMMIKKNMQMIAPPWPTMQ